jgi:putative spermidine/putrescine transport system permease protein
VLTLTGVIGRIDERLEQARAAWAPAACAPSRSPCRSASARIRPARCWCSRSISAYVRPSPMGGTEVLTLPMLIAQQVGTSFNPNFAGVGRILLLVRWRSWSPTTDPDPAGEQGMA